MRIAYRVQKISESPTLAVSARASAMRSAGVNVIDFSAGEPDFATPENIKTKGIEAIQQNFTKYTASAGIKKLRDAIAARYEQNYKHPFRANQVICCNGAKQALFNLVFCLVEDGDEVLIPEPYWVTFPDQVRTVGGSPVFVPTNPEQGFRVDPQEVERRISPRTRLLILNSPNNPSGAVIPRNTMGALVEICAKKRINVIFDECYDCFVFPPNEHSSPAHFFPLGRENTTIVSTFSKPYAMTGWRLGYAIGPEEVIAACDKLQSHTTSNPSSISQMAGVEAMTGDQSSLQIMFAEYDRRRKFIHDALMKIPGIQCSEPQGAFYIFPDISRYLGDEMADSLAFCSKLLDEAHVATVAGSAFGVEGHLRISYATSMENLQEGCKRLNDFLRRRL